MIVSNETNIVVKAEEKLLLPFYNLWNQNVYRSSEDFDLDPFTIRANSTSGSPVIVGKDFFIGFLNPGVSARFIRRGEMLNVICRGGQECFFIKNCDPYAAWEDYNREVYHRFKPLKTCSKKTLSSVEYCTWVEQDAASAQLNDPRRTIFSMLSDNFIADYIARIDRLGLPRGVLTIDHGWMEGSAQFDFSNARPDCERFPDMAKTIARITDAGFIPGLWFAPGFLYENHPLFHQYPELKGSRFNGANEGGFEFPVHYLRVTDATRKLIRQYFSDLFRPYLAMGVKKLKIDFMYNAKKEMISLLRELYAAVKTIDPEVEVESHIPDIFASFYQDAVRMNDVSKPDIEDSMKLIESHYLVCKYSAYRTCVNLDHIGTNNSLIGAADFIRTLEIFRKLDGYPVVSLLPDRIGADAVAALKDYLEEYCRRVRRNETLQSPTS